MREWSMRIALSVSRAHCYFLHLTLSLTLFSPVHHHTYNRCKWASKIVNIRKQNELEHCNLIQLHEKWSNLKPYMRLHFNHFTSNRNWAFIFKHFSLLKYANHISKPSFLSFFFPFIVVIIISIFISITIIIRLCK